MGCITEALEYPERLNVTIDILCPAPHEEVAPKWPLRGETGTHEQIPQPVQQPQIQIAQPHRQVVQVEAHVPIEPQKLSKVPAEPRVPNKPPERGLLHLIGPILEESMTSEPTDNKKDNTEVPDVPQVPVSLQKHETNGS